MAKNKLDITDLAKDIGKSAILTLVTGKKYELKIPVSIKNVEIIYGAPQYTIEPIGGSGQARVRDNLEIQ